MATSYPTRGPGFGSFSVGDMVFGNGTILLCTLKGFSKEMR
jgi:hypothetical protein